MIDWIIVAVMFFVGFCLGTINGVAMLVWHLGGRNFWYLRQQKKKPLDSKLP